MRFPYDLQIDDEEIKGWMKDAVSVLIKKHIDSLTGWNQDKYINTRTTELWHEAIDEKIKEILAGKDDIEKKIREKIEKKMQRKINTLFDEYEHKEGHF